MALDLRKETIRKIAYHDELTGLKSRVFGMERLKRDVLQGKSEGRKFSVIYGDVNKFKPVNDLYGHEAGDFVPKVVARRLETSVRPNDTVIRMGGTSSS